MVSAAVSKRQRKSDPWEYDEKGNIAGLEVATGQDVHQVIAEDVVGVPRWYIRRGGISIMLRLMESRARAMWRL